MIAELKPDFHAGDGQEEDPERHGLEYQVSANYVGRYIERVRD